MRKYLTFIAALVGLSLLGLTSAHADHSGNPNTEDLPHVVVTHDDTQCGELNIHLKVPQDIPDTWQYRVAASVDGAEVGSTELRIGPGSRNLDLAFDEDQGGGEVVVEYRFVDATEWDVVEIGQEAVSVSVDTDCEEPVDEEPVDEDPKDEEPKGDDDQEPAPKDEQPKDDDDADTDDDTTPVASEDGELPDTGGNTTPMLIGAGALLVLGAGGLGLRRMLN